MSGVKYSDVVKKKTVDEHNYNNVVPDMHDN